MSARRNTTTSALAAVAMLVTSCGHPHGERRSPDVAIGRGSAVRTFRPSAAPTDPAWLRTAPPSLPMRPAVDPTIAERRLANGSRVLVVERHDFPSVSLAFVLDRGICDGGTAAAIYGRALGSSPGRDCNDNLLYLHAVAADVYKTVTDDSVILRTTVLPPLLASAISRLAPMFFAPGLAARDLEMARRSLKSTLSVEGSRQDRVAERALREALLGRGGYGTVIVDASEVDGESDAHVREFRAAALSPAHVTVVAVGDTTPNDVVTLLNQYTEGLPRADVGVSACAALPAAPLTGEILVVDDRGAEQSRVYVGVVGVPVGHVDGPALDVLSAALGVSLSSRLSLKIREEHGYTYNVRMRSREWRAHGLVEVRTSVETARTAEALRGIMTELVRAATDPLDDGEFLRAKVKATSDPGGHTSVVASLLGMATYGSRADSVTRQQHVSNVTVGELTRVAATYLAGPRRAVTIVGDASSALARTSSHERTGRPQVRGRPASRRKQ